MKLTRAISTVRFHVNGEYCCVFADGEMGRLSTSPCTEVRVAQLRLRGGLGKDDTLVNEPIVGTVFKGLMLSEPIVGDFNAVGTEVEDGAHACAFASWIPDAQVLPPYGSFVR